MALARRKSPFEDDKDDQNDLQMASGGGHLNIGNINIGGGNVHLGDIIHVNHNTTDAGPHFWVQDWPAKEFINREDYLASMTRWFLHEDNRKPNERDRHKVVVLEGMGGCGKTQLALKFVHSVRTVYWGIFWLDASSQKSAENAYAEIDRLFGKGGMAGSFLAGKHWLSTRTNWLLVLDNADRPELLHDMHNLIPPGDHGHVLITTRNPSLSEELANSGSLPLRDMKQEEGIALLMRCAYGDTIEIKDMPVPTRDTAGKIVTDMLYNLARPINAAGKFIKKKNITLKRYLQLYGLLQKKREDQYQSMDPAEIAVETTWSTPMEHIKLKAAVSLEHSDAVVLFHVFTFLHFTGISQRVFRDLWQSKHPVALTADIPEILRPAPEKVNHLKNRLENALGVLHEYAIIETVNLDDSPEGINKSCYTFHPLVQSSARHKLKEYGGRNEDLRPKWLRHALRFLASALPINAEDLDPKLARQLIPHVLDSLNTVKEIDEDQYKRKSTQNSAELEHFKMPDAYHQDLEDESHSLMFSEEGASLYERLLNVYDAVGQWSDSIVLYKKAMWIRHHKCGAWAESTLQVERNFSLVCFRGHQVEDAIRTQLFLLMKRCGKCLSWRTWLKNSSLPDRIPLYTALSDLSMSLWQAQKHDVSLAMGRLAADGSARRIDQIKRLGHKPDQSLMTLNLSARLAVARTLFHTGHNQEAHKILKVAVPECKRSLRLKHVRIVQDKEDLPLHERRPPGLDHFDTLFARAELALNLAADLKNRRPYYRSIVKSILNNVMEGRKRILGEEHPYTLLGQIDYTKILGVIGEPRDGIPIMDKVLPIVDRTLKDHGIASHLAYGNMARVYGYALMWPEAADAMAEFYEEVDSTSPQFFMVWAAYARLSFRAGRHAESECILRLLVAHKAPRLNRGFKDAATDNILEQLAVLYKNTNQLEKLAAVKQKYPNVNENTALGSMYDTFNKQFPGDDDKLKTLIDLIIFLWKDPPNGRPIDRGRIGGALYNYIKRFGDWKYGSKQEEDEAVAKVEAELKKEGLARTRAQELKEKRARTERVLKQEPKTPDEPVQAQGKTQEPPDESDLGSPTVEAFEKSLKKLEIDGPGSP